MNMFKSRKFKAVLVGLVVLICQQVLGLPDEIIKWVVGLLGAYIGATAIEDGLKGWHPNLLKKKDSESD